MDIRHTILIIDQSSLIVSRIKVIIEELQCIEEIYSATNYTEATVILEDKKPTIVLMDIHLHEMSGIELLNYINKNHPRVKVVMLSNNSTDFHRKVCLDGGALHFIDKSKEFELIPEILNSLIC